MRRRIFARRPQLHIYEIASNTNLVFLLYGQLAEQNHLCALCGDPVRVAARVLKEAGHEPVIYTVLLSLL